MDYLKSAISNVCVSNSDRMPSGILTIQTLDSEGMDSFSYQSFSIRIDINTLQKLKMSLRAKTIDDLKGKEISFILGAINPQIVVDFYIRGHFEIDFPAVPLYFYSWYSTNLSLYSIKNRGCSYMYINSVDDMVALQFLIGEDIKNTIFFPTDIVLSADSGEKSQLYTTLYFPFTKFER